MLLNLLSKRFKYYASKYKRPTATPTVKPAIRNSEPTVLLDFIWVHLRQNWSQSHLLLPLTHFVSDRIDASHLVCIGNSIQSDSN